MCLEAAQEAPEAEGAAFHLTTKFETHCKVVLGREEGYTVKYGLSLRYCPDGAARGQSQGLRLYFTVYPDLSPNTDIIPFLTMIY